MLKWRRNLQRDPYTWFHIQLDAASATFAAVGRWLLSTAYIWNKFDWSWIFGALPQELEWRSYAKKPSSLLAVIVAGSLKGPSKLKDMWNSTVREKTQHPTGTAMANITNFYCVRVQGPFTVRLAVVLYQLVLAVFPSVACCCCFASL